VVAPHPASILISEEEMRRLREALTKQPVQMTQKQVYQIVDGYVYLQEQRRKVTHAVW